MTFIAVIAFVVLFAVASFRLRKRKPKTLLGVVNPKKKF
jgi:hypothetical protein